MDFHPSLGQQKSAPQRLRSPSHGHRDVTAWQTPDIALLQASRCQAVREGPD